MRVSEIAVFCAVCSLGILPGRAAPANDQFGAAMDLGSVVSVTIPVDSAGATRQVGEPAHDGNTSDGTVWWWWTAPVDGLLWVALPDSSSGAGNRAVYTGETLESLVKVAADDRGTVEAVVTTGTRYAIVLADKYQGRLQLDLHAYPANDDFAGRADLGSASEWTIEGTTIAASREDGEPQPANDTSQGPSVWWKWTAPEDGIVRYDLAGSPDSGWVVGVYSGDALDALEVRSESSGYVALETERAFRVKSGEALAIVAARDNTGDAGRVRINWSFDPQPYQATPDDALDLGSVSEASGTADTTGGFDVFGSSSPRLWWSWTAPSNGFFAWSATRIGEGSAPWITVYDDSLTPIWIDSDSGGYRCRAGESFRMSVSTSDYQAGPVAYAFRFTAAQANDDVASAAPLLVPGDNPYDLTASSREPDEPVWGSWQGDRSLWWNWTAAEDGLLWLEVDTRVTTPRIAIWEVGGDPEPVASVWDGPQLSYQAQAGTALRVGLLLDESSWTTVGPGTLHAKFLPAATGNDAFADAIDLGSGWSVAANGDLGSATLEDGEPVHPGSVGTSIWWTWTAPADCHVRFWVGSAGRGASSPSQFNTFPAYRGDTLASLTPYTPGDLVAAGESLWMALTSDGSTAPDWKFFELLARPVPPNDAFATPTDLGSVEEWRESFVLDGATLEAGETHPSGDGSLWWEWTAPRDGNVSNTTDGMSIYRGDLLSALDPVPTGTSSAETRFVAEVGVRYRVAVSGISGNQIDIDWRFSDPPAGDHYATPIELGSRVSFELRPENDGTLEMIDKDLFPDAVQSFWWAWEAPAGGFLVPSRSDDNWHLFEDAGPGTPPVAMTGSRVEAGRRYRIACAWRWGSSFQNEWIFHPDIPNDGFAGAIDLGSVTGHVSSTDLLPATADEMERSLLPEWVSPTDRVAWWMWTAPFDGALRVKVDSGLWHDVAVTVASGDTPESMRVVAQVGTGYNSKEELVTWVEGGRTYRILIGMGASSEMLLALEISAWLTPPNDHWSKPFDLGAGSTGAGRGTNADALREPMESTYGSGSVWWRWTAPNAGNAFVTADLVGENESVVVYREMAGGEPELLPSHDGRSGPDESTRAFRAVAGETYLFSVCGQSSGDEGTIRIGVTLGETPGNDDFAGRIVLPQQLPLAISGSVTGATLETDEPDPGWSRVSSLWWSWTPETDQAVLVEGAGALVSIYRGDALVDLEQVAEGYNRSFAWRAQAGEAYQIAVLGTKSAFDSFDISFEVFEPVGNDDFADRKDLGSAVDMEWSTNNFLASAEPDEPAHAGRTPERSIWYAWTAPVDGVFEIEADRSNYWVYLGVYRGDTLADLDQVGEGGGRVLFEATAGEKVVFAVNTSTGGEGLIDLTLRPATKPPNDNFTERILVEGSSFVIEGDTALAGTEEGEPGTSGYSIVADRTLWWEWVAPNRNTIEIRKLLSTRATMFVYTSSVESPGFNDLRYLTYNPSTLRPTAGERYFIQIRTATNVPGGDSFSYSFEPQSFGDPPPPPPENDAFDERIDLGSGVGVKVSGDLYGATPDPGQSGRSRYGTIWWSWTAPYSGVFGVRSESGSTPRPLTVYEGTGLDSLVAVASGSGEVLWFEARAGERYAIEWRSSWTDRATSSYRYVGFVVEPGDVPGNDNFADAEELPGELGQSVPGHNAGATAEPGEPDHAGSPAEASVWYRWRATASGRVEVSVYYASMRVGVYSGTDLGALTEVASGDDPVEFDAVAGESYRIAVDATGGDSFSIRLLEVPPMAGNDDFVAAAVLAGPSASVPGSTYGATLQDGEPYHTGSSSQGGSVWWRWTAPANVPVELSSDATSSLHLAVYRGDELGSLAPVAVADDRVRFFAETGVEYRIAVSEVYSYSSYAREFVLHLDQGASGPANDRFADATWLVGASDEAAGTVVGASRETGEPYHAWSMVKQTVWYRWTVPEAGPARVSLPGGGPGLLVVYRGTSLEGLEQVGADDAITSFIAEAGETVSIMVGVPYNGEPAPFTVRAEWLGYPVNDDFAERIDLGVVESAVVDGVRVGASHEPGEPDHDGGYHAGSLWWSWTAPADGGVSIDSRTSMTIPTVAVYRGDALGSLQQIPSATSSMYLGGGRLSFRAEAGVEYRIAVDGDLKDGELGDFRWVLTTSPLVNDDFADRIHLPSLLPASGAVSASGAGREPGEAGLDHSVWWDWISPVDGLVDIDLGASEPKARPWVGTGDALMLLDTVALSEVADEVWRFKASAGAAYRIAVGSYYSNQSPGTVVMELRAALPAPNDLFRDALPLAGEHIVINTTSAGAGAESGEPEPNRNRSLWWTWTAPHSGFLRVSLGEYDWAHWAVLYEGAGWVDLAEVVGPNGLDEWYLVEGGRSYWLAAGHSDGHELRVDLALGPAEDMFGSAEDLGAASRVSLQQSLAGCFRENREPFHAGNAPAMSRWSRWTAPWDGTVSLTATPPTGDLRVAVYVGDAIDDLWELGSGTHDASFEAMGGVEYRIAVDILNDDSSPEYLFELSIEMPPGYADWRDGFFGPGDEGSGPSDDPDRDGRDNMLELTLGSNPLDFDAGAPLHIGSWMGYVRLSVRRPVGLQGWWHHFEVSGDLAGWSPTTSLDRLQYIEYHGDGTETFHVILTDYPITAHPRLFARLVAAPGEEPLGP